jgi:hypothetical protein
MSIDTDYATLRRVIHEHNPTGWAVEFGVYTGYSLDIIARHMPVIGFDSFEGLPEDWRPGFEKGKFSTGWSSADLQGPNRMLVPGWFTDTVPMFPFPDLALVHIDCDLYSSTVTALEAITTHVDVGTLLVFDEYHGYPDSEEHEAKAFNEWLNKYGVEVSEIATGSEECAFIIESVL